MTCIPPTSSLSLPGLDDRTSTTGDTRLKHGQRNAADPWAWVARRRDGVTVRVARTREDAEAARALIRDAWGVAEDERYFYGLFDDAEGLYRSVIEPALFVDDLRDLDAICLILEAEDQDRALVPVATFSLVFEHQALTVEIGRGAVARAWQRRGIPAYSLGPIFALLATIPEYALIADVTSIARGAKAMADALKSPAVALHPSNFTVQPGCVDGWLERLGKRRGAELAHALLLRSERTGLGRFTTSYHVRRPASLRPLAPVLDERQRPFFEHTCRVSALDATSAGCPEQTDQARATQVTQVHDRHFTATRTIVDPRPEFDVQASLDEARAQGFETLVIQVPCDRAHQDLCRSLERHAAILGGVMVDSHGVWRASYTLLTTAEHDARVRRSLALLDANQAFDGDAGALLRLVNEHANAAYADLQVAA